MLWGPPGLSTPFSTSHPSVSKTITLQSFTLLLQVLQGTPVSLGHLNSSACSQGPLDLCPSPVAGLVAPAGAHRAPHHAAPRALHHSDSFCLFHPGKVSLPPPHQTPPDQACPPLGRPLASAQLTVSWWLPRVLCAPVEAPSARSIHSWSLVHPPHRATSSFRGGTLFTSICSLSSHGWCLVSACWVGERVCTRKGSDSAHPSLARSTL